MLPPDLHVRQLIQYQRCALCTFATAGCGKLSEVDTLAKTAQSTIARGCERGRDERSDAERQANETIVNLKNEHQLGR
jgi:hypothetical protein